MSAAWPLVVDRLVALLPTLPGWSQVTVYDGPPATADTPTSFITVGYVPGEDFAGTCEQSYLPGGLLSEIGSVRCELAVWSGDDALASHRAAAFALIDALGAVVGGTLGVLPQGSSTSLSVDPQPVQNAAGSAQRAVVTVNYTAIGL
jgi:hypothetical protein